MDLALSSWSHYRIFSNRSSSSNPRCDNNNNSCQNPPSGKDNINNDTVLERMELVMQEIEQSVKQLEEEKEQ